MAISTHLGRPTEVVAGLGRVCWLGRAYSPTYCAIDDAPTTEPSKVTNDVNGLGFYKYIQSRRVNASHPESSALFCCFTFHSFWIHPFIDVVCILTSFSFVNRSFLQTCRPRTGKPMRVHGIPGSARWTTKICPRTSRHIRRYSSKNPPRSR